MPDSSETQTERTKDRTGWTPALLAVFVNQIIVTSMATFLTLSLVMEAGRVAEAIELAVPQPTRWYYDLGPGGIVGISLAFVAVSATSFFFQRRLLSVLAMSLSFIVSVLFLGAGVFYAVFPLFAGIRHLLPPGGVE